MQKKKRLNRIVLANNKSRLMPFHPHFPLQMLKMSLETKIYEE